MTSAVVFHRPALAARLSKLILQVAVGSSTDKGFFLTAPKGTGKTTFILEDLRPALEADGAVVIYVELMNGSTEDPGAAIGLAVGKAVASHLRRISPQADASSIENARSEAGVASEKNELRNRYSLGKALIALSDKSKQPIVLIIDDAQHVAACKGAEAALDALKAARDVLNDPSHYGLRIIFIGSNREKLSTLRNAVEEPFFSAPIVQLPTLDQDFITWLSEKPDTPHEFDSSELFLLFQSSGYQPDFLNISVDELCADPSLTPETIKKWIVGVVRCRASEMDAALASLIQNLKPIELAIIRVMHINGENYAPFDAPTMSLYAEEVELSGAAGEVRIEVPSVQQALISLQEKNLIWRASRGTYGLEQQAWPELIQKYRLVQ